MNRGQICSISHSSVFFQRIQGLLPLNPTGLGAVSPDLAFNTAVSFATNTNWQSYGGETTLSYLTQMVVLTVQNFVSAAAGMAVLVAFICALVRKQTNLLGNSWVDLTRGTLYILLSHIFDKFYRVQRPESVIGTGLGLSICKGIAEAHGGFIGAENRIGGGTIVTLALPIE